MDDVCYESDAGAWIFRATEPPPDLAPYVTMLWETSGEVGYAYEKLLPSGNVDLMINLGPPQSIVDADNRTIRNTLKDAWVSGLQSRPLFVAPSGVNGPFYTHFIGASLRPESVRALFGIDGAELANDVIEADAVFGRRVDDYRERIGIARCASERFDALIDLLRALQREFSRPLSCDAVRGKDRLLGVHGNVSISTLCQELGVSRKHLNSLFSSHVGVSPKTYARLLRFRAVVDGLSCVSNEWVRMAAVRGYFDQSHLIRDFGQFAGEAPMSFLQNASPDGESVNYL